MSAAGGAGPGERQELRAESWSEVGSRAGTHLVVPSLAALQGARSWEVERNSGTEADPTLSRVSVGSHMAKPGAHSYTLLVAELSLWPCFFPQM